MTKSMTGSFYLTEAIDLPAGSVTGTRVTGTIDLSAYVNVPTGQAIAVESCDLVFQNTVNLSGDVSGFSTGDVGITLQVVDQNPGAVFVRADNHSLVASGTLNVDATNNVATHTSDLYPDNFGPANMSEAFLVVNDTLFITAGSDGTSISADGVSVSARLRCRVVKLSTKDWMAIAIQSTADQ